MLPINVKQVIAMAKDTYDEQAKEEKKKQVSCSQQALANQLVSQSMNGMAGAGAQAQPQPMNVQSQGA